MGPILYFKNVNCPLAALQNYQIMMSHELIKAHFFSCYSVVQNSKTVLSSDTLRVLHRVCDNGSSKEQALLVRTLCFLLGGRNLSGQPQIALLHPLH